MNVSPFEIRPINYRIIGFTGFTGYSFIYGKGINNRQDY